MDVVILVGGRACVDVGHDVAAVGGRVGGSTGGGVDVNASAVGGRTGGGAGCGVDVTASAGGGAGVAVAVVLTSLQTLLRRKEC